MEFIRGLHNIKLKHQGCIATMGNFDGLHIGHQAIIKELKKQAKVFNLPTLLITFEPFALEFFLKDKAPARLLRLREKIMVLQGYSLDRLLCLRFNSKLADLSPEEFVKTILVEKLGIRYLIVGRDFRFGKAREGDVALLKKMGERSSFQVETIQDILYKGERVGSSWIRRCLAEGDLQTASELMDRPYKISGHVIHGNKHGRLLGFPTANIALNRQVSPVSGVFAVKVHGLSKLPLPGVANVGWRPTIGDRKQLLEVYLFNFQQDIYGKFLQVELIVKLREEKSFSSLELLKAQIGRDAEIAKKLLEE